MPAIYFHVRRIDPIHSLLSSNSRQSTTTKTLAIIGKPISLITSSTRPSFRGDRRLLCQLASTYRRPGSRRFRAKCIYQHIVCIEIACLSLVRVVGNPLKKLILVIEIIAPLQIKGILLICG